MSVSKKSLNKTETAVILQLLEDRFKAHMKRHKGIEWSKVAAKLAVAPSKLRTLALMEESGGEPDVVLYDKKSDEYTFMDCSPETPKGRRSCCFDEVARLGRKENAPAESAEGLARAMGVEILTETEYRALQKVGEFDLKTSSWLATPEAIRERGGAIFGDRRYDQVFVYHNGADSYYGVRGFRARVVV
jgi:hypothetical protein